MATQPESSESVTVTHVPDRSRYELAVDGDVVGLAAYRESEDGVLDFIHTVVDDAHEGKGLAGKLVAAALADVSASGKRFTATCPYVVHWLTKHHEFDDARADAPPAEPS